MRRFLILAGFSPQELTNVWEGTAAPPWGRGRILSSEL